MVTTLPTANNRPDDGFPDQPCDSDSISGNVGIIGVAAVRSQAEYAFQVTLWIRMRILIHRQRTLVHRRCAWRGGTLE